MMLRIVFKGGASLDVDINENPVCFRRESLIIAYKEFNSFKYDDVLTNVRGVFPLELIKEVILCEKS